MKVLITGGAGFIGSHLAERHLLRGDEVFCLDDLSTGAIENILHLKANPNFNYIIDTITNYRLVAELVDLCDVIYHLAAAVGVRLIVESPVRTIETNIRGTEIVLDLAAKKQKRIPTVIARLFNTVGPRQTGRYGMVIPNFVRQALAGEDITVYGDGSQSRCFTHVSDAVSALMGLIEHPEAIGEVYNVGSSREVTILEVAERIKWLAGSDSRIVFVPYQEAYEEGFEDMMRRVPDISKINKLIGYAPKISLDEILTSIIEYHSARLNNWQSVQAPAAYQA